MNDRVNSFSDLSDFVPVEEKPIHEFSHVIEHLSKTCGFPSRQSVQPPHQPPEEASVIVKKLRRRRTGRDKQVNIKTNSETIKNLEDLADATNKTFGEVLELALKFLRKKF